jgi:hypothetical protein
MMLPGIHYLVEWKHQYVFVLSIGDTTTRKLWITVMLSTQVL